MISSCLVSRGSPHILQCSKVCHYTYSDHCHQPILYSFFDLFNLLFVIVSIFYSLFFSCVLVADTAPSLIEGVLLRGSFPRLSNVKTGGRSSSTSRSGRASLVSLTFDWLLIFSPESCLETLRLVASLTLILSKLGSLDNPLLAGL